MSTPFRFKNADNTTVDFEDYYVRADYFRSGNLWTWGSNLYGGLGDNTTADKSSPVQTVTRGSNWKQVDYGSTNFSKAVIKTDGTLWLWGYNVYGNLGDNTTAYRSSPVQTVAGGTNWSQVACNFGNIAAIKTNGTLWLWGDNSYGQLGDNTITNRSSPVQTIVFGTNWSKVACGGSHTAAIKTDGTLWVWGRNNAFGQLGDNTITNRSSPVQTIAFGTNWKSVTCGQLQTAAIKTDGTLWDWGYNSYGQLGDNTTANRSSPVQTVAGGTNWKQVMGGYNIGAIKTDGTLWSWGYNQTGSLGDNTTTSKSSPVQTIAFGKNWKQIACGGSHTAAIKTDGTLWNWGGNSYGGLGDNTTTNRSSPVQTTMYGNNWKQVACGQNYTAAIQYQDDYQ